MNDINICRLPGFAVRRREANFCARPDGTSAFIFDSETCVLIRKEANEIMDIATDLSKHISMDGMWMDFSAVVRDSKLFILALRSTGRRKNEFIFSLSFNSRGLTVVDKQFIGVNRKDYPYGSRILQDEKERLYLLTYDNELHESNSSYGIAKIAIDENGKMTRTVLSSRVPLESCYFLPFIQSGSIHWLRFNGWFQNKRLDSKLLKISLVDTRNVALTLTTNGDDTDNHAVNAVHEHADLELAWSSPIVSGESVFFLCKNSENAAILRVLNCEHMHWETIALNEGDHPAVRYNDLGEMTAQAANGFLMFHVRCSQASCPDKAHIYTIDVSNYGGTVLDDRGIGFITACIGIIEERGLHEQGLYRSNGIKSKIRNFLVMGLRRAAWGQFNLNGNEECGIQTISGAVKAYLRNLRMPLIPFELRNKFINATKLAKEMNRVDYIHFYVYKLPENHFKMLRIIIKHLKKVADESSVNLMTVHNLGTCFGPSLLRPSDTGQTTEFDVMPCNSAIEILIANSDRIFNSKPKKDIELLCESDAAFQRLAPVSLPSGTDSAPSQTTWYLDPSDSISVPPSSQGQVLPRLRRNSRPISLFSDGNDENFQNRRRGLIEGNWQSE